MALTTEQKELGTAIAKFIGTTLNLVPQAGVADEYLAFIGEEIKNIANEQGSGNVIKDETEAVLDVLDGVGKELPDSAKGKKKYVAAVAFMKAAAHMFGL